MNMPPMVHPEVSPLTPVPTLPGLTVHVISGEYEVMVQRSQELESTHMKDLLLSFAGGFMSISLLILATSGMARPRPSFQRPVNDGAMSA